MQPKEGLLNQVKASYMRMDMHLRNEYFKVLREKLPESQEGGASNPG